MTREQFFPLVEFVIANGADALTLNQAQFISNITNRSSPLSPAQAQWLLAIVERVQPAVIDAADNVIFITRERFASRTARRPQPGGPRAA
jgi:hypothetical protein